jgi:hypothetical protein
MKDIFSRSNKPILIDKWKKVVNYCKKISYNKTKFSWRNKKIKFQKYYNTKRKYIGDA